MWGLLKREKSENAGKDEDEEAPVDEEEIENNIKEVNTIRSRVVTEKWIAPIDLALSSVKGMRLHKLSWKNMTDMPNKMKATNTGNTVIVSAKWNHTRPHIRGGSLLSTYVFSQLHFHWGSSEHEGSEHRINGISYPLEMHAVFFKSLYLTQDVALTKEDGVVTVVYLFKLTSETNEVLNLITSKLADIRVPHSSTAIDPTPLSTLLYPFNEDYFMYWGKLQTTVCEHPVLWIISRHAFGVTQSQLMELRNLLSVNDQNLVKNFRDPCPLNERPVFHVNPSSNLDMILLPGIVKQDLQLVTVMYNYINECYNKYHTGSKNISRNVCDGDTSKADYDKATLPGSEKLTKYDFMYNTMQSSGIKILFLLREITNILHQRILQGGTNHVQNRGGSVLQSKENIAEAARVGRLNRECDRSSVRMRNMRRNMEPSILMKPKLCKNRNINNLVRLKQANSRNTAVYNKQNYLMRNNTFPLCNRPSVNLNLMQSDENNTPPVNLSNCKYLFNAHNKPRKSDEKLVSKIQIETNKINKLKQVQNKRSVTDYFNLPQKTINTSFSPLDCRTISMVENNNRTISDETVYFKSTTKPHFKELATIREESRILRQETPSTIDTMLTIEDKENSVEGPFPLNQFGLNTTQEGVTSQTMLLEKNAMQTVQNHDIQICNNHEESVDNENNIFGVKKLAALSKQLMNVFNLSVLSDNESRASCNQNTNSVNEQRTHQKETDDDDMLEANNKQEISQNDTNVVNKSVKHKQNKSDGIIMKSRMPMSLNNQVMSQVIEEDTGIETNPQETAPVENDLNPFLLQSDTGDSQLIQNKNYIISSKQKESIVNVPVAEQYDDSHHNSCDMISVYSDAVNTQTLSTMESTNIFQNDSTMVTNLKLMPTDVQELHQNKTERVDEANHHGVNSIQRSVNTIRKQHADNQNPSSKHQGCYSVKSETTDILKEGGVNGRDKRKIFNKSVVTENDSTDENYNSGNKTISSSSKVIQHFAVMDENSCGIKGDYGNVTMRNDCSNFTAFSQHESNINQNSFKTVKPINHENVHISQIENCESVRNQPWVNTAELVVDQRGFSSIINKTNHHDFSQKYCNRGIGESYDNENEYLYDDKKTIEQINEQILSLFSEKDDNNTDNINSKLEKIMYKAVSQNVSEENLHINTTHPALMREMYTFPKQLTSLYQNSNFENVVTDPNSVTSSRMPSVSSVATDKSLINKVTEQINIMQRCLNRSQNRSEKAEEPRNDNGTVRRNTRTVHNNFCRKNADNKMTEKNNKIPLKTQNAKPYISKIPKPIPVYAKAKKKLETKIPRPTIRLGTSKDIKHSTGPETS